MVWLIIIGFIALFALSIWVIAEWDYRRTPAFLLWLIPIAVTIWALSVFAYNRALEYQTNKCANWSIETGYKTKYVNVGYGDWNCYGQVADKWLPIERIRGIENE